MPPLLLLLTAVRCSAEEHSIIAAGFDPQLAAAALAYKPDSQSALCELPKPDLIHILTANLNPAAWLLDMESAGLVTRGEGRAAPKRTLAPKAHDSLRWAAGASTAMG